MLVLFQVNNFRIRVGKKGVGHIMTPIDTVAVLTVLCRTEPVETDKVKDSVILLCKNNDLPLMY